ncbi:MAG: hypothetical protein UY92_C0009G0081 [Candidatus Magasanikbacteria bacterium GW2011_GWA2_56_11]|uniref:Uncharacterized protein n=1 Tax=Candidatus Magasanikbacteria bacterium GW2011_GWA2_56_11 TaxID=1619044 RepID=A0A0G2ALT4_9BACT|nr:MAG: hypothetical protein UY92_C0009G0081 [Candidatus Magasanikbacteria bacterium GW2011_GWA2_56_11]
MLITHYQFMKSFLVRLSLAALLAFCLLAAVGVKAERPAGSQETAVIPQSTSGQLAAEARDTKETPGATQEMPSAFDLLLKKVKQNIELIFTLDPVADAKKHWRSHRLSEAEITKKEEELRQDKELQAGVQKDIKVYLIFDKIAELENIQVQEGENMPGKVMELLLKEAQWETK